MFVSLGGDYEFLQARDAPATSESVPWLLACVIFFGTCAVWGITNVQLFLYLLRHVNDPWKLKALALSIWTLDTLHQALITYRNPIIPIGANFVPFSLQDIVFDALPFLPFALVSILGQAFFAYECGRVSNRKHLIPSFAVRESSRAISTLILIVNGYPGSPHSLSNCTSYWFVVSDQPIKTLPLNVECHSAVLLSDIQSSVLTYQDELANETAGWLIRINGILHLHNRLLLATASIGASLNILMTGFLIAFLWRGYVRNGFVFQRRRPLFFRVVLLFANTGFCTAIYSFLTIFMIAYTRVVYDLFGVYVKLLAPLYTCSVLANLNSRDYLTAHGDHVFLPIDSELKEPILSSRDGPIQFRAGRTFETELPSPE
ncbi:hypothetical protein CPB84DRAFT_1034683 [Gymnopilus junonius]|uniref:DUF6534 domain-containing protein n=1 Tax=Gymnopilus junonius TaxID=109634 RepID=A0A9P5TNU5_GYMJU|nr:hypothetical protein CPB84DRAFT_1034683 [Gymnopilus junonius]